MSGLRFLLDEDVDPKTATYLRNERLHAEHARDAFWQGGDDNRISFRMPENTN
jgi:hypothetical protein